MLRGGILRGTRRDDRARETSRAREREASSHAACVREFENLDAVAWARCGWSSAIAIALSKLSAETIELPLAWSPRPCRGFLATYPYDSDCWAYEPVFDAYGDYLGQQYMNLCVP